VTTDSSRATQTPIIYFSFLLIDYSLFHRHYWKQKEWKDEEEERKKRKKNHCKLIIFFCFFIA
jgi:hypothetical protein